MKKVFNLLILLSSMFFFGPKVYAEENISIDERYILSNLTENSFFMKDVSSLSNITEQKISLLINEKEKKAITLKMKISDLHNASYTQLNETFGVVEIVSKESEEIQKVFSFFDIQDNKGNNINERIISQNIQNDVLTQTINIENITGEITATAYSLTYPYDHYFNYSDWIDRQGEISLSISPKSTLTDITLDPNYAAIRAYDSWDRIVEKHSNDSYWSNPSGLQTQYICHYRWAKSIKTPWNIEPWRTGDGSIWNGCNP